MKSKIVSTAALFLAFASIANAQTWTSQTSGVTTDLNAVYFTSASTGFAVGAPPGNILKTINGGTNWSVSNSGLSATFTGVTFWSIRFSDANTGYATGSGFVVKTTDGGASWTNVSPAAGFPGVTSFSLFCVNASVVYVVGYRVTPTPATGIIYKTTDGGTTWAFQTPTASTLQSVYFTDANTGYAVGSGGVIKTTDAGTVWTAQTAPSATWYGVHFTDANTGYATGWVAITKTTNAGANWTSLTGGAGQMNAINFPTATTGYVVGNWGSGVNNIRKTTDAGATWTVQVSDAPVNTLLLKSVHCPDANTCYTVGSAGKILKVGTGAPILALNRLTPQHDAIAKVFDMRGKTGFTLRVLPRGVYAAEFQAKKAREIIPLD